jgi:lipopolysaccharide export LptBFGC system permease protein LptF
MTLDREILALRASGVNLFSIFFPALIMAALISMLMMNLAGNLIPRLLLEGMKRASELQLAVINSLEPGRFHDRDDLPIGGDQDLVLYFRERDPRSHAMKGVMLKMEEDVSKKKADVSSSNSRTTTTRKLVQAQVPGKSLGNKDNKDINKTKGQLPGGIPAEPDKRNTELTLVFAESGTIVSQPQRRGSHDSPLSEIVLNLKNGSVHRLAPNPKNREYTVLTFAGMQKWLHKDAVLERASKTQTNAELREVLASNGGLGPVISADQDAHTIHKAHDAMNGARRELMERRAISLASLVFALIAIPLAIWIKPSGKSWGILLAIGLMLVYYILMKMGLSMVEMNKPMGGLVTFSSNILFLALGLGFWWHTVRS